MIKIWHIHDRQTGQHLLPSSFGRIQNAAKRHPATHTISVSDFWFVAHRHGRFVPARATKVKALPLALAYLPNYRPVSHTELGASRRHYDENTIYRKRIAQSNRADV